MKAKLENLKSRDFELLKQAYFLDQNDEDSFVCFGSSYAILNSLKLIDDDNKITHLGKELSRYMMGKLEH